MSSPHTIAWPGILLVVTALANPSVCFAAPPANPHDDGGAPSRMDCQAPRGPGPPGVQHFAPGEAEWELSPPYLVGLALTEEQQDKVFGILYAAAPAIREQAKSLRKAHEAVLELTVTAQYEEARLKGLAEASAKAESQIMLLRARTERDIYLLLTPAQREKVSVRRRERGFYGHGGTPPR